MSPGDSLTNSLADDEHIQHRIASLSFSRKEIKNEDVKTKPMKSHCPLSVISLPWRLSSHSFSLLWFLSNIDKQKTSPAMN